MFVNKLKMDKIAEAVKKCMAEDDLEETGLRKAAHAAHNKGEKMFTFKGKTYPVKVQGESVSYGEEMKEESCADEVKKHEKRLHGKDGEVSKHVDKMHKEELSPKQKKIAKLEHPKDKIDASDLAKLRGEEVELDEADKVATSTGMKVYGSSYGNSAKARRDQLKRPVDDTKGPKPSELAQMAKVKKEEFFKDRLITNYIEEEALFESELQEVLSKDATAGDWISDFVHSDNPKFEGKSKKVRQKMALAAYYAKQKNESVEDGYPVTTDTLAGRMPGGMSNSFKQFKLRVKPLAKDTEEPTNVIPANRPAHMTARDPHIGNGGLVSIPPQGVVRNEEVELKEDDNLGAIAKKHGMEFNRTTYGAGMKHPTKGEVSINRYGEWNHKGTKATGDSTNKFASLDKHLSSLKEESLDEDDASNIKKDIAASRLELKMKNRDIADKSYLKDKPGSVKSDIKNFGRFLAGKKETNEETDLEEAVSRKDFQIVADLIKTHDNHDKRKELATHHAEIFHRQNPRFDRAKFMKAANVNEGKQPETDNVPFIPFEGPYTKSPETVKDKSGAVHTPMSRARDLAKSAMKRVKTEMLGKAPGNNG